MFSALKEISYIGIKVSDKSFHIMTVINGEMTTMVQNRLERWSIFCADGMVMVLFSQQWNVDGF